MTHVGESLTAQAYDKIKNQIIVCDFKPGEKITINRLMEELDLSRTPVREALVRLQDAGLVHAIPQSGTFVSKIDLRLAAAALYFREVIECQVTSELCDKATEEDIARLRRILEKGNEAMAADDPVTFFKVDNEFHHEMYAIAGHPEACTWMVEAATPLDRYRYLRTVTEELPSRDTQNQHRRIINAIEAGEVEAVRQGVFEHLDGMLSEKARVVERFPTYFENAD